mmetsp:Transcript_146630/g.256048  ORF Transcript_146630/g.256048 Transcript_146630/m.256048 type:complete len:304 (+) Transcript_146630:100-1011(+)
MWAAVASVIVIVWKCRCFRRVLATQLTSAVAFLTAGKCWYAELPIRSAIRHSCMPGMAACRAASVFHLVRAMEMVRRSEGLGTSDLSSTSVVRSSVGTVLIPALMKQSAYWGSPSRWNHCVSASRPPSFACWLGACRGGDGIPPAACSCAFSSFRAFSQSGLSSSSSVSSTLGPCPGPVGLSRGLRMLRCRSRLRPGAERCMGLVCRSRQPSALRIREGRRGLATGSLAGVALDSPLLNEDEACGGGPRALAEVVAVSGAELALSRRRPWAAPALWPRPRPTDWPLPKLMALCRQPFTPWPCM